MSDWASERKIKYLSGVFGTLFVILMILFFTVWYDRPTCFDGFQNGGENGIDCGGECQIVCTVDTLSPVIRWQSTFRTVPGIYNAVAYVENPNVGSYALNVPYVFKVYNDKNILIGERVGVTTIPAGQSFAVFEGGFEARESVPKRVTFEFTTEPLWQRQNTPEPNLVVTGETLINQDLAPRLNAVLVNQSLATIKNIELVAIVYDGAGNAIGVSKTIIDELPKDGQQTLVFTWPLPFETAKKICQKPVDVMLVLDRSGSMSSLSNDPPQPLTDVKQAAITFVNQLTTFDQAGLATFATEATTPIDADLTNNFQAVREKIGAVTIAPSGQQNTNIGDGLRVAVEELTTQRRNPLSERVVVLLTDGVATDPTQENNPNYPEDHALAQSAQAIQTGVTIYTIGLGQDVNDLFLETIAGDPDRYYPAPLASSLSGIYQQIATEICQERPVRLEIIPRILPLN